MSYRRAPITEAVIEFRFESRVPNEQIEKLKKALERDYPLTPQISKNITVRSDQPKPKIEFIGYRLVSSDAANIVNIKRHSFSASRLAPYTGWEDFVSRARADWATWKKVVGWIAVTRIGVRYINRIDVPNPEEEPLSVEKYLLFRPLFPQFDGRDQVETFAVNGVMPVKGTDFKVILNAGSAESPLIKTTSFLLDIDISRDINLPKNDDTLWAIVDEIRPLKNRIFEASITDATRNLLT